MLSQIMPDMVSDIVLIQCLIMKNFFCQIVAKFGDIRSILLK